MADFEEPPDGFVWWTFEEQTVVGHALTVIVGVAVWVGVYCYWLETAGNLEFAAIGSDQAIDVRHAAWQAASTACWLWFAVGILVGKGGPFRNGFVYPATLAVVGPWIVSLALFQSTPRGMHTTAFYMSPQYVADAVSLVVPGMLLTLLVVAVFAWVLGKVGRREAWERRHMPQAWHDYEPSAHAGGDDE